jgi:hypothetical protein
MSIQLKNDKYWVGFLGDRDRKQAAQKWCWENWGPEWGEIRDAWPHNLDHNYHFVFHQLAHANWFHLKWS